MKLYLFNDHTAAIADDHSGKLTTIPPTAGTLTVGSASATVTEDGDTPHLITAKPGVLRGEFITTDGIRYTLDRLRTNASGIPVTLMEDRGMVWRLRQIVDNLQIKTEDLTAEVARLRGIYEEDALGFLIPQTVEIDETPQETNT